jgi:hypothetical protein
MTEEVIAVLRDASGYRTHRQTTSANPDSFHIPAYHVAVPEGESSLDGTPFYRTACGRSADETTTEDVSRVPAHRRCQRPGCKQRWPES